MNASARLEALRWVICSLTSVLTPGGDEFHRHGGAAVRPFLPETVAADDGGVVVGGGLRTLSRGYLLGEWSIGLHESSVDWGGEPKQSEGEGRRKTRVKSG